MKKVILLKLVLLFVCEARAATFNISNGNITALINAINTANGNSEADVINLATNGTYILTSVNYTSPSPGTTGREGQRGLPDISNNVMGLDLTINGNGATIQRNTASVNFGLFSCSGQTVFNNLTFRNGNVNAQGAAVFVQFKGNVEFTDCKFYDNNSLLDAEGGGGAIYTKSLSALKITACYFENNSAVNQGGAISNLLSDMSVINSIFKNNRTTDLIGGDPAGGAIYSDGARGNTGTLVMRNNTYEGNSSNGSGQGGAMFLFPYNSQTVEVTGCTFKSNSANQGGAFWHKGGGSSGIPDPEYPLSPSPENTSLLLNNCVFESNTAANASGGALWLSDCKINEIHTCTFKNNTASLGGAIAFLTNRTFTLRNCTFNNNTANQAGAINTGGISAPMSILNCTFDRNIANAYGGAISTAQNDASKAVNITNCTFANNQANNPGNGQSAAIHSGTNGTNSTVTIKNNIFTNNTVTNPWNVWRDCNCILNDGGNNLFFPAGVSQNCVTTPNFANPLLSPLANNGGPTPTMALQTGSPAINAGAGCPTFDQRGAARVGVCDIGAFEFGSTLTKEFIIRPSIDGLVTQNNTQDLARKYVLLEPTTDIKAVTLTSYLAQIVPAAPLVMNTNDSPKVDFDDNKPLAEQDTISFSYFESLMAENRKIPTYLAEKYVKNSTIQFDDATNFVGQEQRIYLKEHKVLYLKFGDSNSSKGIIICYDNNNRQTSWETFLLSCNNCGPNFSRKEVVFLSDNTIEVVSFKLQNSKEMPNLADIDAAKTEKYFIESNGKISKR
jgi:predicted outer membrane repeat protein